VGDDVVTFVRVRADHQRGAETRPIRRVDGVLAYCPDPWLRDSDGHGWRSCDAVPAAYVTEVWAVEAAIS